MSRNLPSPRAVVNDRVNVIYSLIVRGLRREHILAHEEVAAWGLHSRQIDTYIAKATKRLEDQSAIRRKAELGKALARFDSLYMKMVDKGDFRGALKAQHEVVEMLGLRFARDDGTAAVSVVDEWLAELKGVA